MSEYIDREAFLSTAENDLSHGFYGEFTDGSRWAFTEKDIEVMLNKIPAANVQPAKWIPTAEQLPERFDTVIVCGKMKYSFEKEYERFVDVACFDEPDKEKDQDRWSTFNDWYEGQQEYEITHWMPLPEPPKDGDNNG